MKYQEVCAHCQHVNVAYIHNLNSPLVKCLRKLVDYYRRTLSGANLQRDLHLTINENNNFQKLQYFDLVSRVEGKGWYPTQCGIDFICGEMQVPNRVATINSNVLPGYHPAWNTTQKRPMLVAVWEVDETSHKKREEYQQEKSRQLSLS